MDHEEGGRGSWSWVAEGLAGGPDLFLDRLDLGVLGHGMLLPWFF
jgi:hypothetical protein